MQKMLSMLRKGVVLALSCFDFAIAIVTSLTIDQSFSSMHNELTLIWTKERSLW